MTGADIACAVVEAVEKALLASTQSNTSLQSRECHVGPVADRTIATMHVDQLFLGVHGMDARAGFTTPNLAEAATNRALVECAREVVVLADSTKWGVVGLADIAPLTTASTLVTDDGLADRARQVLTDTVGTVITVETAEQ